jgi:SAM-dependent methyltransferase
MISMAALAYEVLLIRLFSIIQWHHFAYMIISLALLGYGASGTFLAFTRRRLLRRFPVAYIANLVLFAVSAVSCYLLAQSLSFNAEEVLWDPTQPLRLMANYLLLSLPFFFGANCIALALARHSGEVSRIYAADLFGAGLGSICVIALLFILFPSSALRVIGTLGLIAAAVAWLELRLRPRAGILAFVAAAAIPFLLPSSLTELAVSPYKGLPQLLRVTGTHVIEERSSPLGLLSVVESAAVPLREAPGLSLNAMSEPPPQLGVFTDGDAMTVITRYAGKPGPLRYLDQMTSSLPYHLNPPKEVLILGAGGGSDVLQALYQGANRIDAVELNPQIVDLVRNDFADFSGRIYDSRDVHVHVAEARGFVSSDHRRHDLIQLALLDSFGASSAGLYALSENYLYTVQALQEYLAHLKPGGYLAITRWVKLPPRDTLKLFATATDALRQSGVPDPGSRLALIRGWQTSTLLVKNGVVTKKDIAILKAFCEDRSFDVAYYPGMPASEANRYNILQQPYFYLGATALVGPDRGSFLKNYKFNLHPATDDRPYFFHFLKWRDLPEILSLRNQGGMPLLEWGYLVLIATLLQAILASIVLVLMPLWFLARETPSEPLNMSRLRVFAYFFSVGLAFLFVEIAFIQKFILFLHHPVYAVAAVLAAFLMFAGVGSAASKRWAGSGRHRTGVAAAVTGILVIGVAYAIALGPLIGALGWLPVWAKIVVSVGLIAPLALCMGMPFPLALSSVAIHAPALVPWAWGVNGCASVLSAVLATLLAIHFGFTAVLLMALALYGLVALVFPGPRVDRVKPWPPSPPTASEPATDGR